MSTGASPFRDDRIRRLLRLEALDVLSRHHEHIRKRTRRERQFLIYMILAKGTTTVFCLFLFLLPVLVVRAQNRNSVDVVQSQIVDLERRVAQGENERVAIRTLISDTMKEQNKELAQVREDMATLKGITMGVGGIIGLLQGAQALGLLISSRAERKEKRLYFSDSVSLKEN